VNIAANVPLYKNIFQNFREQQLREFEFLLFHHINDRRLAQNGLAVFYWLRLEWAMVGQLFS
jgi:hypothetical protein